MIPEAIAYKKLLGENFIIDDLEAVDIILAVVAAHKITGNMLWLRLIGAPSSGKTEILRSLFENEEYCAKCESVTPAALRRGYIPDGKKDKDLPKFLERLDGKLAITKEFGVILTANKDSRKEVFGLLRSVHDGELVADYGSDQGYIVQKAWFDWIIGTTNYVEKDSMLEQQLGARFIDLRWRTPIDSLAMTTKALTNDGQIIHIRKTMFSAMNAFIEKVDPTDRTQVDVEWLDKVIRITSKCRTHVERDNYRREDILSIPEVEATPRLATLFGRIINGLRFIGIENYKPYIIRLMFDNMPSLRSKTIKVMLSSDKKFTQQEIANELRVSQVTVGRIKEDLNILGFDLNLVKEVMCFIP